MAQARSQTTWSGSVTVTSEYTVSVFDELIISACTNVKWAQVLEFTLRGVLLLKEPKLAPSP